MKKGFKGLVVWVVLEGILLGGFLWWMLGMAGINVGKLEAEGFIRGDYVCAGKKIREGLRFEKEVAEDYGKMVSFVKENGHYNKEDKESSQAGMQVILHPVGEFLVYRTGEEAVSFFKDRYPDMEGMEIYFWGDDYQEFLSWNKGADGSVELAENYKSLYSYRVNLGGGEKIRLQAEVIGEEPGELFDEMIYQVKIYEDEKEILLQELRVKSCYMYESPFVFEDFNADGYLDLTVIFYYGANGGTASHYIFSPSQRKFVRIDDELDYYGWYFWDTDARILYMHYHSSAISGAEASYQWEGETEYKKIRQFDHDDVGDGVQVKIVRFGEYKEEVICDYVYSMEEYDKRSEEIWSIYYKDFIWEQEVTDSSTGKKYMLRYAEQFKKEMAAYNKGIYYDGKLYVFDEDTYLMQVWQAEIVDPCSGITWDDEKQELAIHYGEGLSVVSGEWLFGYINTNWNGNLTNKT
ncbi:hypothetical protein IMSAGC005_03475 [Lachnospiraceae bacterium]|nr:hypothetical protein IMSAGC005_03475 [Lachnospiraceae bacterium]